MVSCSTVVVCVVPTGEDNNTVEDSIDFVEIVPDSVEISICFVLSENSVMNCMLVLYDVLLVVAVLETLSVVASVLMVAETSVLLSSLLEVDMSSDV